MSRATLEAAIAALGAQRGLGMLQLDADGSVTLSSAAGLDVTCSYLPEPANVVVLYAELGTPGDPMAAFRKALEANHLWGTGDNLTLGLLPGTDEMTACMMLPIDGQFEAKFSRNFDHFADRALHWAKAFANPQATERSSAEQPEDHRLPPHSVRV